MDRFDALRRIAEDEAERKRAARAKADELLNLHRGTTTTGE